MKNKSDLLFGGDCVVKMFCCDLMQNVTDFSIEQIVQDAREYAEGIVETI
jgi:hypothetical protein